MLRFTKLPISELHLHVEATLTPGMIAHLAQKNQMKIPDNLFREDGSIAYKEYDFIDFLAKYDTVTPFLRDADDIEEMVYDYLKRCHEGGAIYVELSCSPDHAKKIKKSLCPAKSSRAC